ILANAGRAAGVDLIGKSEIAVLLQHDKDRHDLEACEGEEEGLARLSEVLDAAKLITGHLGRWGTGGYLLVLSLSDVKRGSVEASGGRVGGGRGCPPAAAASLDRCAIDAAVRLLSRAPKTALAASSTAASPFQAGATVAVLDLFAYGAEPEIAQNLTQLVAL